MQPAYPPITDERRELLASRGLKVYQPEVLPALLNPFSSAYWWTNAFIVGVSLLGRRQATKTGGPRMLWTTAIVGVPLASLIARIKLDSLDEVAGGRKTLEQKLEHAPIARNAWERALETNVQYQNELQEQIKDLQINIARKQAESSSK